MKPSNPPSEQQLNPTTGCLDERTVVEHLLGKTPYQAAQLLRVNSAHYSEDYTWMGAAAFIYYAPALLLYLDSADSDEDFDFAYSMIQTFRFRLQYDGAMIAAAIPVMREFCQRTTSDSARLQMSEKYEKRLPRRILEFEAQARRVANQ